MAYQTEIVAMLSGGMSFRRLMWPYFLGALIIASLSLGLNLWLIPVSQRSCVAFENQYIPRKARFQYDKISTVRSNPVRSPISATTPRNRTRLRSSAWKSTNRER